jgi:predicted ABC-type ATPase
MANKLYIIAGCNGAGKTTASFTILPDLLNCKEFINADEIARGLSPFQPEKVAIEAGKLMLLRFDDLLKNKVDFAVETTLATKIYKFKILKARSEGYKIILLFFWLQDVKLALERVKLRVLEGGHFIDENTIKRRYKSGLRNLIDLYLPIVDQAMIFDNSDNKYELLAEKSGLNSNLIIVNESKLKKLKKSINYD